MISVKCLMQNCRVLSSVVNCVRVYGAGVASEYLVCIFSIFILASPYLSGDLFIWIRQVGADQRHRAVKRDFKLGDFLFFVF